MLRPDFSISVEYDVAREARLPARITYQSPCLPTENPKGMKLQHTLPVQEEPEQMAKDKRLHYPIQCL